MDASSHFIIESQITAEKRQKNTLLSLHNSTVFTLWRPMDNYSDLDMTTLTELPDLCEVKEIPLDSIVNRAREIAEHRFVPSWEFMETNLEIFRKGFDIFNIIGFGHVSTLVKSL